MVICHFPLLLLRSAVQFRVKRRSLTISLRRATFGAITLNGIAKGQLHVRLELLVIVVFDNLPYALRTGRELQGIHGARIGREPVETIDLLPVRLKPREQIFLSSLAANIRDGLSVGLHDLKVLVIDPNLALEIALILLELRRRDIEDIAVDLIDHFFSDIFQGVLRNVVARENKRLDLTDVLQILGRERDILQRVWRRFRDPFGPFPRRIEGDVAFDIVLTQNPVIPIQVLNPDGLVVCIVSACASELLLLLGEPLNDVVGRNRRIHMPKLRWALSEAKRTHEQQNYSDVNEFFKVHSFIIIFYGFRISVIRPS